jgi:hypothetical protein
MMSRIAHGFPPTRPLARPLARRIACPISMGHYLRSLVLGNGSDIRHVKCAEYRTLKSDTRMPGLQELGLSQPSPGMVAYK